MNENDYSAEEKADIIARVDKAKAMLTELKLQIACMPQMFNTGDDVFGIKLLPYLQDKKYTPKQSPIQKKDL